MLLTDVLIVLFVAYSLLLVYIGNRLSANREIGKTVETMIKTGKPGGLFKEVPSSIINRPSAKDLKTWNEDPEKKKVKAQLSNIFAQDKELVKLKEQYSRLTNL